MKRLLLLSSLLVLQASAFAIDVSQPEVQSFIDEMVSEHDFDRDDLTEVLASADLKQGILDAIARTSVRSSRSKSCSLTISSIKDWTSGCDTSIANADA
ncbi:MAG: hypothetical protein QNJ00_17115, partial [Woeseiaceae bacterium]|nr:hypothetical protein [Woeseiaceae bacterium]